MNAYHILKYVNIAGVHFIWVYRITQDDVVLIRRPWQ